MATNRLPEALEVEPALDLDERKRLNSDEISSPEAETQRDKKGTLYDRASRDFNPDEGTRKVEQRSLERTKAVATEKARTTKRRNTIERLQILLLHAG